MLTTATPYLSKRKCTADNTNYKDQEDKSDIQEKMTKIYDYFSNLNPLAFKIALEIREVAEPVQHLWAQLSPNEKTEIVNDIFIKPEISLLYEKHKLSARKNYELNSSSISSPTSSLTTNSVLSLCQDDNPLFLMKFSRNNTLNDNGIKTTVSSDSTATASTTMITIASNEGNTLDSRIATLVTSQAIRNQTLKSISFNPYRINLYTKSIYQFDGKNLSTFCKQKTGLKVLNDDLFGTFSDEHSMPFSVKTKSQINLVVFDTKSSLKHDGEPTSALKMLKFQNVHKQLAENVIKKSCIESQKKSTNSNSESPDESTPDRNYFSEKYLNYKAKHRKNFNSNYSKNNNGSNNMNINYINHLESPCDSSMSSKLTKKKSPNNDINIKAETISFKSHPITTSVGLLNCKTEFLSFKQSGCQTFNEKYISKDINQSKNSFDSQDDDLEKQEHEHISICDDDYEKNEIKEDSRLLSNDILRKGFEFLNNW